MTVIGDYEAARPHRQAVTILTGDVFGRTDIVAEGDAANPGPHAFLVEQRPDVVLPTHFHLNDQFQVVVAGRGTLGRRPIAPVAVHYARGRTGYGPITAGPDGLHYLTLRARLERGAHYLMDPKTVVDRTVPKVHATSAVVPVADDGPGPVDAPVRVELLPAGDDGLGAWLDRLPAGAAPPDDDGRPSAGRFHVVVSGTAQAAGRQLGRWSCVWASASERTAGLVAGPGGLELLTLRYPLPESTR